MTLSRGSGLVARSSCCVRHAGGVCSRLGVALVSCTQLDERIGQDSVDNVVIVQVQPLKEGLVQVSSSVIRCMPVKLGWLVEHPEVGLEHFCTNCELLPSFLQPLLGALPIDLYASQAGVNLVSRQLGIGGQVQQPLFPDIKCPQLLAVAVVQVTN